MKHTLAVFLSLLLVSLAACTSQNQDLNVSNLRTALDKDGENVTSFFSPSDVIYVVTDLVEVPRGTRLEVKWIAVNAKGTERNHEFDSQTLEITEELFTGKTYFQLSNAAAWPVGQYRVDLYLNGIVAGSVEFSVQ
jgi:hypothetical protein